jgi:rhamnulokinase
MNNTYLAIDFGGGSGRVIAGQITGGQLHLDEIYRFSNRQIKMGNHIYWDFLSLFEEMKNGIRLAVQKGYHVTSIGIDTWGVDFGLLDRAGNLLGNPRCYRDPYTEGAPEEVFKTLSPSEHYRESGIQVMPINSLFQLYAMKKECPDLLECADKLLFTPDLFSYFLTGTANNEYCIASTSELILARERSWNWELIKRMGFPSHLFGEIVMPGTSRGNILPSIAAETGLPADTQVIAVGSHDTASAVFAVPFPEGKASRCAFLSSGTWSLLGVELDEPILSEEARQAGFTNEGCTGGKIKFLQNITGLWILQRLMQQWKEAEADTSYGPLLQQASESQISGIIDVDNPVFTNPADMEKAIAEYCLSHYQEVPVTKGDYVMCVLKSLAARYKKGIEQLNSLLPEPIQQLHIIGGGCQNQLLNRLTEEALGIPVIAGPVEATAIGNILMQAQACGAIKNKNEVHIS